MNKENKKKKGIVKKVAAVVLGLAFVGTAVGIGIAVSNRDKVDPTPDDPIIVNPLPDDPKPDDPIVDPTPTPDPDPTPEPEPDEPDIPDEPDVPVEPEPEPTPEPEPEPDPEPVEPEQEREDMIFFEDTGELNTEGFHKALMYIMENYEYKGLTLNEIFYERTYNDYEFFAVNWSGEDNKIYLYTIGELKSYSNNNNKEIKIAQLIDMDLKADKYENSLDKFIKESMNDEHLEGNIVYRLQYCYTEDELKRLDDYYEKAYEMSEYRVKQDLGKNDVVLGSFIEERKSMPAGLGIGNSNAIITHYWVLNEKTNELREWTSSIYSSSVLGEGFVKNLMASPITGSKYVVVGDIVNKDVITIDKDTLYNVENGRVMSAMRSVDYENYDVIVDEKLREL